ncbi:MAG: enoyl-CoA hydratase/isomerase family protein [Candidatus Accumulibacter sp.]|jgi:2-(1,2-epoxy-1,2-dihydrophenyl)acetyl-CoA isomerase|nr:enoyl-CoA hydratase/isomerase family protein [Accumulibacter sp.]
MNAVLYEIRQNVAILKLNQPESLNAVNPEMTDALLEATVRAANDPAARAVLVCAQGKHFMAGGDLKWFQEQLALPPATCGKNYEILLEKVQKLALEFQQMEKPVIVAARGAVAGFGLSLMVAADLVFAAEDAYFTLAYSNIALSPDGGSSWTLPRLAGLKKAMEIALLGERFDAAQAREMGLVNRLCPAGQLDEEAEKLARRLALGPAKALAKTKALINRSFDVSFKEQLLAEQRSFVDCAAHPDFAEGLAGFFEKRKPVYNRA